MSTAADCPQSPGVVAPVIDVRRCEAKSACEAVCPFDVFEVRALTRADRTALPFWAKIKVAVHGGQQGFVVRPQDCHGCGLCVAACPEHAIRLLKR